MSRKFCRVLTIAGSDSGGGAGVQADLKTFSALGCYGMSAITAVTAQNSLGVQRVEPVPVEVVRAQSRSVLDDIGCDAVKLGMLCSAAIVEVVCHELERLDCPIVCDPVMVSTSGRMLLDQEGIDMVRDRLLPTVSLVTPNLDEAAVLLGRGRVREETSRQVCRELLVSLGCGAVLLTGGHGTSSLVRDYLLEEDGELRVFEGEKIHTRNLHGTGCTLASAIAACLAKGLSLVEAVKGAKRYVEGAITAAMGLRTGAGNGPLHHFHDWWTPWEDGNRKSGLREGRTNRK